MKRQISKVFLVTGMAVSLGWPATLSAESPIRTFVDSEGRIVFANSLPANSPIVMAATPKTAAPGSIHSLIESAAHTHGVDPALVAAVIRVESGFDPWARSPKGAMGLMQLIPATGWRFGVRDFFDPRQNIEGGVRYLKFLLEMFDGNVDLALASYNAGENLVKRLGRIPAIPETRDYVRKIRAIYKKGTAPVLTAQEREFAPEQVSGSTESNTGVIFRAVDERGVVGFSNIAPPN
jgi:soluble lytic murein transglycosylase-like protein